MNFSLLMRYLVHEKHKVNTVAPSQTQPNKNTQNRPAHTSDIYCLPQFTTCARNHTHPHRLIQLSLWFQIALLPAFHKNLQFAALPMSTSTSKLRVFFKGKCHNYRSIHILCVCLCLYFLITWHVYNCAILFLISLSFLNVSLTKFWVLCP